MNCPLDEPERKMLYDYKVDMHNYSPRKDSYRGAWNVRRAVRMLKKIGLKQIGE
jgi:hypothetical protein